LKAAGANITADNKGKSNAVFQTITMLSSKASDI
jgi:hypothetical protein